MIEAVAERCQRVETVAAALASAGTADTARLQQLAEALVADGRVDGVRVVGAGGRRLAGDGPAPAGPAPRCSDNQVVRTGDRVQLVAIQPVPLPAGGGGTVVGSIAVDGTTVGELSSSAEAAVVLLDGAQPVAASGTVGEQLLAAALAEPGTLVRRDGRVAQLVRAGAGTGPLGVLVAQDSWLDLTWLQRLFPLVVLGSAVLAVGIATGLARATTSPLQELGRGASRVADGDLTTAIEVRSRDEVGQLATAFNRMTE